MKQPYRYACSVHRSNFLPPTGNTVKLYWQSKLSALVPPVQGRSTIPIQKIKKTPVARYRPFDAEEKQPGACRGSIEVKAGQQASCWERKKKGKGVGGLQVEGGGEVGEGGCRGNAGQSWVIGGSRVPPVRTRPPSPPPPPQPPTPHPPSPPRPTHTLPPSAPPLLFPQTTPPSRPVVRCCWFFCPTFLLRR